MSRADRRIADRNYKKSVKAVKKLTPEQVKVVDILAHEKALMLTSQHIERIGQVVDSSMRCAMYECNLSEEKIEEIMDRSKDLIDEDSELYQKGEIDMDKKLTREMIIKSAMKHGLDKEGRKKIAKELKSTYSTISTYISRWKITEEDLKSKTFSSNTTEENKEDTEVDIAAEKIMEIIEGKSSTKDIDKDQKALDEIDEENIEEYSEASRQTNIEVKAKDIIEEAKTMQCKLAETEEKEQLERDRQALSKINTLKVKSMVLEGANGIYKVCPEGVELQRNCSIISFANIEDVDKWAEEVKEVFRMAR